MARDWPFFRTLLDDVDMVLAKSDLDIYERYSRLAGALHERYFPRIAVEFAPHPGLDAQAQGRERAAGRRPAAARARSACAIPTSTR